MASGRNPRAEPSEHSDVRVPLIQPPVNPLRNGTSTNSIAPIPSCLPRLAPPRKENDPPSADEGEIVGPHSPRAGLKRSLTVADGVSMVLGVVVGSGIFATPVVVLLLTGGASLTPILLSSPVFDLPRSMVLGVVVGSSIFATPGVHGAGSGGGQRHIRHARCRPAGLKRVAAAGAAAVAAGRDRGLCVL
ncbi:unnamed protein product [Closterium sp. Naga37s-1]|nr:unnamed protein product [Closterium sp. Naga37s-1]